MAIKPAFVRSFVRESVRMGLRDGSGMITGPPIGAEQNGNLNNGTTYVGGVGYATRIMSASENNGDTSERGTYFGDSNRLANRRYEAMNNNAVVMMLPSNTSTNNTAYSSTATEADLWVGFSWPAYFIQQDDIWYTNGLYNGGSFIDGVNWIEQAIGATSNDPAAPERKVGNYANRSDILRGFILEAELNGAQIEILGQYNTNNNALFFAPLVGTEAEIMAGFAHPNQFKFIGRTASEYNSHSDNGNFVDGVNWVDQEMTSFPDGIQLGGSYQLRASNFLRRRLETRNLGGATGAAVMVGNSIINPDVFTFSTDRDETKIRDGFSGFIPWVMADDIWQMNSGYTSGPWAGGVNLQGRIFASQPVDPGIVAGNFFGQADTLVGRWYQSEINGAQVKIESVQAGGNSANNVIYSTLNTNQEILDGFSHPAMWFEIAAPPAPTQQMNGNKDDAGFVDGINIGTRTMTAEGNPNGTYLGLSSQLLSRIIVGASGTESICRYDNNQNSIGVVLGPDVVDGTQFRADFAYPAEWDVLDIVAGAQGNRNAGSILGGVNWVNKQLTSASDDPVFKGSWDGYSSRFENIIVEGADGTVVNMFLADPTWTDLLGFFVDHLTVTEAAVRAMFAFPNIWKQIPGVPSNSVGNYTGGGYTNGMLWSGTELVLMSQETAGAVDVPETGTFYFRGRWMFDRVLESLTNGERVTVTRDLGTTSQAKILPENRNEALIRAGFEYPNKFKILPPIFFVNGDYNDGFSDFIHGVDTVVNDIVMISDAGLETEGNWKSVLNEMVGHTYVAWNGAEIYINATGSATRLSFTSNNTPAEIHEGFDHPRIWERIVQGGGTTSDDTSITSDTILVTCDET